MLRKNIDVTVPPFNTALLIYPTRKQVKEYNAQRLTELTSSQPSLNVYDIVAHDTMISAPGYLTDEQIQSSKSSDESETAGLTQTLHLANGSRVMLLRNTFTDEGLVNGAQGTVQGIEWGDESQIIPRGVYVLFDNPLIGQSLRHNSNNELHNSILIRPTTANFYGKFNVHWSRTQIPLTPCWATTVHKVQGITLQHAVIDIGSTVFTSGMSYVALSRIQNITGLAIQNLDTKKLKASDIVITEMGRLLTENTLNTSPKQRAGGYLSYYYYCNRSGSYTPKGKGKRELKIQGSSKIGVYYTAYIRAKKYLLSGEVFVEICDHHIHEQLLCHLRLPDSLRMTIAAKLNDGVTISTILDSIRDNVDKVDRGALLCRQDIHNVGHQYNIDAIKLHENDL